MLKQALKMSMECEVKKDPSTENLLCESDDEEELLQQALAMSMECEEEPIQQMKSSQSTLAEVSQSLENPFFLKDVSSMTEEEQLAYAIQLSSMGSGKFTLIYNVLHEVLDFVIYMNTWNIKLIRF